MIVKVILHSEFSHHLTNLSSRKSSCNDHHSTVMMQCLSLGSNSWQFEAATRFGFHSRFGDSKCACSRLRVETGRGEESVSLRVQPEGRTQSRCRLQAAGGSEAWSIRKTPRLMGKRKVRRSSVYPQPTADCRDLKEHGRQEQGVGVGLLQASSQPSSWYPGHGRWQQRFCREVSAGKDSDSVASVSLCLSPWRECLLSGPSLLAGSGNNGNSCWHNKCVHGEQVQFSGKETFPWKTELPCNVILKAHSNGLSCDPIPVVIIPLSTLPGTQNFLGENSGLAQGLISTFSISCNDIVPHYKYEILNETICNHITVCAWHESYVYLTSKT